MEKIEDEWAEVIPDLPLPIFFVGGRYLLFDIKAAAWLRREHNVCGYNIGTLPQAPSQNVFLGLPIMIMPEEAQILVDKEVAYVVDDGRAHDQAIYDRDGDDSKSTRENAYLDEIRRQASKVEQQRAREHLEAKERALSRQREKAKAKAKSRPVVDGQPVSTPGDDNDSKSTEIPQPTESGSNTTTKQNPQYHVTPTSSHHLLRISPTTLSPPSSSAPDTAILSSPSSSKGGRLVLPGVPTSYALFRHLHSRGFFMTPGLRFGCQYSTYPGDPLRYHSHFLAVGVAWDQELDLMDLVGGGRLGTGVKKGFLIGGVEPCSPSSLEEDGVDDDVDRASAPNKVRTFTLEWAVM